MKRIFSYVKAIATLTIFAITIVILGAMTAKAGAGFYASGIGLREGTSGTNRYNSYSYANPSNYLYGYGGGLIYDSAVALDKVFNYRLKAGYDRYYVNIKYTSSDFKPAGRFNLSHTFGFGVARTEDVRVWIGPQLGFHYFRLSERRPVATEDYGFLLLSPSLYNNPPNPYFIYLFDKKNTVKHDFIGLNLLLSMGLNVNLGDHATIFFDFGIGYMGNYSVSGGENPLQPHNVGIQASTGFMFRIDDIYRKQGAIRTEI